MPIFDSKRNLINQISALRSLNGGFPKLKLGNSIPSLNNVNNPLSFLIDLVKNLIGFEQIKIEVINFFTYKSDYIERNLKQFLKLLLKKKFSCNSDATIPSFLIDGSGVGFNIAISQIDFFDLFKVNPNTIEGNLLYGDLSQDLNTFLYDVIQGNLGTWKSLLKVEYLTQGVVDGTMRTNVLNIKIESSWLGQTVNDFINNFVESITLFDVSSLINKVFDTIWGVISSVVQRSSKSIEQETKLEILINKIISLPDIEIDNSYFKFNKDDLTYFNTRVDERTKGRIILKDCNLAISQINFDDLNVLNTELKAASTKVEIKKIIERNFDILISQAVNNLAQQNQTLGILSIFEQLFRGIVRALINLLLSPKIMSLFVIYFNIVSISNSFKSFDEFLEENQQLIIDMVLDLVLPIIIEFLLELIIKIVTELVIEDQLGRALEMIKNQQLQILSLIGVPDKIRDLIEQFL